MVVGNHLTIMLVILRLRVPVQIVVRISPIALQIEPPSETKVNLFRILLSVLETTAQLLVKLKLEFLVT